MYLARILSIVIFGLEATSMIGFFSIPNMGLKTQQIRSNLINKEINT